MGKNKLQKFEEMAGFLHVVQPAFDEVFQKDYQLKGQWAKEFFKNELPLVLELGCGKGEYSVGLARKFRNKNFIGVDIKGSRMHAGASQSLNEGLKNVGFLRTRIEMINSFFGKEEIGEIWLTFPDPQMNKTRKRLTSVRFLNLYAGFLKPGGMVHLKTDSQFLYSYTKAVAAENGLTVLIDNPDLYNGTFNDEILSIRTYYEERFLTHGIPIKYFSFLLDHSSSLREPIIDIPKDIYHNAGRSVKIYGTNQEVPSKYDMR